MNTNQESGSSATIAVTELAVERVKEFMQQENIVAETSGLRVSAAPGGCSGLRYWLNIEEQPLPGDHIVEQDGLRLFVDASSAPYLNGSEIDFVSTAEVSGFKVNNPNETSSCGCDCSEQCST